MSVKKILSIIMALAMVLTVASFPAFAEGTAVAIVGASGKTSNTGASNTIDKAYDGSDSTCFLSDQHKGSLATGTLSVVFELEKTVTLDSLTINWGKSSWGYMGPDAYNVYVSEDNSDFTQILTYTGLNTKATAAETYSGYTYVSGSSGNANMCFNVAETGLNVRNVKYIKIEVKKWVQRPAIREISVTEKEEAALVPASYTVKYQYADGSEALADKVVSENVYVGDTVTEEAPEIVGYLPDEATKSVELVDGTNEIVFTYTARTAATYTVNYVDAEGVAITDAKVVTEGYYENDVVTEQAVTVPGYKPRETSKEATLAAGENTIEFVYDAKDNTSYTINYVDTEGTPIADAVVTEDYEDEVITVVAPVISGYFYTGNAEDDIVDYTKTITLDVDAANNVITFVYKKVAVVSSIKTNLLNGTTGFWATGRIWNSMVVNTMNIDKDADQISNGGYTGEGSLAEIIYTLNGIYDVSRLTAYWSGNSKPTAVTISTSLDGEEWTPVYTTDDVVYTERTYANTSVDAEATRAVAVSEFDLEVSTALYVKYTVDAVSGDWAKILEVEVEGTPTKSVALSESNVKAGSNWGWADSSAITNGTVSALFDGKAASKNEAFWNHTWSGELIAGVAGDVITIDLGGVIDNPILTVQGGYQWGYTHLVAYEVYAAGVDGIYGETPVGAVDYSDLSTDSKKNRKATDLFAIEGEAIRYIKIVPTAKIERAVLGEITVYGTLTDVGEKPEDTIATLGGQIRLPQGSISAGIRFGATVLKETVGIVGEYVYDPAATTTFGMFLIPQDLLAGATFADYLVANDYAGLALKVPAQRIYSQDDYSVEFTAVLVDIPEGQYTRNIVAVPYICTEGVYTFSSEIVRNYAEVATSVAAKYEAGEVALSATQITLIEGIIGRPLVAPEVA